MLKCALALVLVSVLCKVHCQQEQRAQFHVVKEWDYLNFTWPSAATYRTAIDNGHYIPVNVTMSGIQWSGDRFYIALPRMKTGVPATLATVSATVGPILDPSPALEPYPSWEMNALGDCNALQNVQNVAVDSNENLWVIDGGRTGTLSRIPDVQCPPKLVVIDTKTNRTTTMYTFPEDIAMHNGSFLYDITVDKVEGDDTYAYITDNSGTDPGIIVYSLGKNRSWKIRDDGSMRAFLEAHDFTVNEFKISVPINLAGIALGPNYINSKYRNVYYTPISSFNLYSISTEILRNESYGSIQVHPYVKLVGRRTSQTDGMAMDSMGSLYFGLLSQSSIAVWNSSQNFNTSQRVIARDPEYIQWPNAFTFDGSGNIIVLSNRLHKFIYGNLSMFEPNFRLLTAYTGTRSYVYGNPLPARNNPDTMGPLPAAEPRPGDDSTRRYDYPQHTATDSNLYYNSNNKGQSDHLQKTSSASGSSVIYALYTTIGLVAMLTPSIF